MGRAILVWMFTAASLCAAVYPDRWVFVSRGFGRDSDVEEVRAIAQTARDHGLTGIVLSAGLDRLDLQPPAYFDRVRRVKEICDELGLEIIPNIFSVGYGGSIISHDRNLAEGLPVRDALMVVSGGEARISPDPPVAYVNGGLEQSANNKASGFQLQDSPGQLSFVDREVFAEGAASLRFERIGQFQNARLMQEIAIKPHRNYRVTFQVKTEGLQPASAFRLQVLAYADGRTMAPWTPNVAPTTAGWRKLTWGFNSLGYDRVRIYTGTWAARGGTFWLDDFHIEEVALLNVVRRPGTPVSVRSERDGTVYEEGVDHARIEDKQLTFRYDHDMPALRLLPASRIQDGERLRVSYYHGVSVNNGQVSVCMSEPKLYEIQADQARRLHELLAPKQYLLSMDEIRAAGSCEACRSRGISTAEILGDCLTRQMAMLRAVNPDAVVWAWSDMLDPNHNAVNRYYLVEGDYTGSWKHVPKDLGIVTWYYAKRDPSLAHFSGLGFRTLAGAYYDGDTLDNPKGWLESLGRTPGARGIMYTTWQNKYGLLADFGDLVSRPLPE